MEAAAAAAKVGPAYSISDPDFLFAGSGTGQDSTWCFRGTGRQHVALLLLLHCTIYMCYVCYLLLALLYIVWGGFRLIRRLRFQLG